MQIKGLHKNIYKVAALACKVENHSERLAYEEKLLKNWALLKSKGCTDQELATITGISRATYYRRKRALAHYGIQGLEGRSRRPKRVRKSQIPEHVRGLVFDIRRENPTYGKLKITRILQRDHAVQLSESSVGRILHGYFEKGLLPKYRAARKRAKKRAFKGHAKRWSRENQAKNMGEMVQIDHMSVSKNQQNFKHFQAWDPVSKTIVAECYSNATSRAASRFLDKVREALPFPLQSIQVDGGSEFMKHFEHKCAEYAIPLYVLPPKSPKLNGGVERGNRTFREDLYAKPLLANNIAEMRQALDKAVNKYNEYRPHQALKGDTPYEYTQKILAANQLSHML